MMIDKDCPIPDNTRVRLKPGDFSEFYGGQATIGSEGVITRHQSDKFGLPMVYIEWDKDHWAWNGALDQWTMPDHFEIVEEAKPEMDNKEKTEKVHQLATDFADALMSVVAGPSTEPESPSFTEEDSGAATERDIAIQNAIEALKESEAFVLVGMKRESHPQAPDGMLRPYQIPFSLSSEAAVLVSAHMGALAAKSHQTLALRTLDHELSVDGSQ